MSVNSVKVNLSIQDVNKISQPHIPNISPQSKNPSNNRTDIFSVTLNNQNNS